MKKYFILSMAVFSGVGFLLVNFSSFGGNTSQALFSSMLDVMEEHSLYSKKLNWNSIRQEVMEKSAYVNTDSERKALIYRTLQLIETNHTFVKIPNSEEVVFYAAERCKSPSYEKLSQIPPSFGYVYVPGYQSAGYEANQAFANNLLQEIMEQDKDKLTAWIIDLRSNVGGNMYPMLAGLGPFFNNGILGYFLYPNSGKESHFSYNNGTILIDENPVIFLENYRLKNADIPIYIFISGATSSSGEAVVIALKSVQNSILVGEKTCGRATGNQGFELPGGYGLFLTTSYMADRDKQIFIEGISPDQNVPMEEMTTFLSEKKNYE